MERIFDVKAPATAPFGVIGWIFMGSLLGGIPLMGLAVVVTQMGASDPGTTAVVALVCLIPIAILYTLYRLFTKFRLSVFADGSVAFVQPFKTTRLAKGQVASATWTSNYVAASNSRMKWMILGDAKGNRIEAISPISFDEDALNQFVETLKRVDPGVQTDAV
jgi:hypothetical protein